MRVKHLKLLTALLFGFILLLGCEGPEGPTGPAGNANVTVHIFDGYDFSGSVFAAERDNFN